MRKIVDFYRALLPSTADVIIVSGGILSIGVIGVRVPLAKYTSKLLS